MPNVLNSNYADVAWLAPLHEDFKLRLGAQAMVQKGVGEQLLTGTSFSTWSAGLKADLMAGGTTWSMAYQQTGSGSAYQTPYAAWAGYTYMIIKSFNQAGMKAGLLGGNHDFAALGVPGLVVNGAIVHGWDAVDAATGAAQPNWTEYDLTLDYRFNAKRWPEWARPFWVRGRAAYVTRVPTAASMTTASSSTTSGPSRQGQPPSAMTMASTTSPSSTITRPVRQGFRPAYRPQE